MPGFIYDGPRKRRGRPSGRPATGTRKIATSITLLPAQYEWLLALGHGNLSQGIRNATAKAMQVARIAAPGDDTAIDPAHEATVDRLVRDRIARANPGETPQEDADGYRAGDIAKDEPAIPAGALDGTAFTDFD